jgi:hypothetical protein
MPGARCTPRSRAQWESGCAHEHTGSAEASGIPCVMALRLMPCSPRRRIRLVTVVGGFCGCSSPVGFELATADLAPATGVRTTRFCSYAKASFVLRACQSLTRFISPCDAMRADAVASTTSHPAFVTTRDRPSCRNGMAGVGPLIWGFGKTEYCPSCQSAATRRANACCSGPSRCCDFSPTPNVRLPRAFLSWSLQPSVLIPPIWF